MHQLIDMTDKKIGWWTVLERSDPPAHVTTSRTQGWWLCKCKCGIEKIVNGGCLRAGKTKSCGCRHRKRKSKHVNLKNKFPKSHGDAGIKRYNLYQVWIHTCRKCYSPKEKDHEFQKNGIQFYEPWRKSYLTFKKWAQDNGYKKGMYFHRKNESKDFSPQNCEWITKEKFFSIQNSSKEDLSGRSFGNLTVIRRIQTDNEYYYECKCKCGNDFISKYNNLVSGRHISCGCKGKLYTWSKNYPYCTLCKRDKYIHANKGICKQCYDQLQKNPEYTPAEHLLKENRWATYYDACILCNQTKAKHHSKGVCRTCRSRIRYHKFREKLNTVCVDKCIK